MAHVRKHFIVYPPHYDPNIGRYVVRYSKRQAWKIAIRMGVGAVVDVVLHRHPKRHTRWVSATGKPLWEVTHAP